MKTEEAEALIETTANAVCEQYILPLVLALGTLTTAVCREPELGHAVSSILRDQYESCPENIAGRIFLKQLSFLADPDTPDEQKNELRTFLRLLQGGKTQS